MTVAALTPSVSYLENGVTLAFAVPFRFNEPSHLKAVRVAADGTETVLTYGAAWSASGGSTDAGGTLTLTATVAGATLRIERLTPRAQVHDYETNDRFPAEAHEAALDRLMMVSQEQDVKLADHNARALMVPRGETAPLMPSIGERANKAFFFDAAGDPAPQTLDEFSALSRAWAEGPEPGGIGTRSSKGWAEQAVVNGAVETAKAARWAEGPLPGGVGTKSAKEHAEDSAASAATAEAARDVSIASSVQYPTAAAAVAGLADGAFGSYLDGSGNPIWGQRVGVSMVALPGPWIGADKIDYLPTFAGAYDDLPSAITAAGVNGTLVLQPGVTYTLDRGLTSLAGQRIIGHGATLKRRNQIVTTTTTAMTSGATSVVTLTDATGFVAGMQVAFAQAGVARSALVYGTNLSAIRTITAVSGNQITLNSAVDINVSIGGTCFLTFVSLTLADGATMEGITFDGNRANWSHPRWEVTIEAGAISAGNNQNFLNCWYVDAPGEAILPYGDDIRIEGNRFDGIGGNAVHLSGVAGAIITNNIANNGNIDTAVGHADGFVSFSNDNSRVIIDGNKATSFISGVGAMNNTDSDVTISDNDFNDLYCFGIEGGAGVSGLTITGNRIDGVATDTSKKPGVPYYGGIVFIALSGSDYLIVDNLVKNVSGANKSLAISQVSSAENLKISDNILHGDTIFAGTYNASFSHNQVEGRVQVAGVVSKLKINRNTISQPNATSAIATTATAAYDGLEIEGNTITGGTNGIDLTASGTAYTGVNMRGNKMVDQTNRAINFPTCVGTLENISITDNEIRVGATAGTSFIGIYNQNDKVTVARNRLSNSVGASSRIAIYMAGASTPTLLVLDNEVRDAWAHTLYLTASSGMYARGNLLKTKTATNPTGNNISGEIVF